MRTGVCNHPGRGPRGGMCLACKRAASCVRSRRYAKKHPDRVADQKLLYDIKTKAVCFRVNSDLYNAFRDLVGAGQMSAAIERAMQEFVRLAHVHRHQVQHPGRKSA